MQNSKSKGLFVIGVACAACCLVPLAALIGASSLISLSAYFLDALWCAIPLVVVGIALFWRKRQKNNCCVSDTKCGAGVCNNELPKQ